MNITFENKRVLVTGAGNGIGKELAKAFVKCKAKSVFALSRTNEHLEKLVSEEPSIIPVCVDLVDWDATRVAVENIGPIDILVNNAGVSISESFLDVKPETFDKVFNINVKSLINVSQIVTRGMISRKKGGSIVNVSSQASQMALHNHTVYAATKAAIDSITRVMALELGQHNIRVNAVNPTVVMTDMSVKYWSDPEKGKWMLDRIPLHRFCEIEDVIYPILFLCSHEAGMINAATLPVEGGALSC